MYTNNHDLYGFLTIINDYAHIVPFVLLGLSIALIFNARRIRKYSKERYIGATIFLVIALIIGALAYTNTLKPRCCGEGFTYTQTSIVA